MGKFKTVVQWGKVWLIALGLLFGNLALVFGWLFLAYPIEGPIYLRGQYLAVDPAYADGRLCDAKEWGETHLVLVEKADGSFEFFSLSPAPVLQRYRRANRQTLPAERPYTCQVDLGSTVLDVTVDADNLLTLPESAAPAAGLVLPPQSGITLAVLALLAAECGVYALIQAVLKKRRG